MTCDTKNLLDLVKKEHFLYERLYFYLKYANSRIKFIWCNDPQNITSAIVIVSPSEFQSKPNALIWADKNCNIDALKNWNGHKEALYFRTIPNWIYEHLKDSWEMRDHYDVDLWYLPENIQLEEPHHTVEDLREEDIEEVNRNWSYAKGKISGFVQKKIASGETFAIYLDGKLASYALFRENGSMGMLRTLPEFRGKGLAKSITWAMVKWVRQQGYIPHVYVVPDNTASQHIITSCGFVKTDKQHWFVKE